MDGYTAPISQGAASPPGIGKHITTERSGKPYVVSTVGNVYEQSSGDVWSLKYTGAEHVSFDPQGGLYKVSNHDFLPYKLVGSTWTLHEAATTPSTKYYSTQTVRYSISKAGGKLTT